MCAIFIHTFYFALALGAVAILGIWEWTQFARLKQPLIRFCDYLFRRIYLLMALY